MAYYIFEFDIPANTPENAPLIQYFEVNAPNLNKVTVIIPNGHQGLARLRVESRERAIVPTNGSNPMYVRGDGNTLEVEPRVKLDGPTWQFKLIGWNADTTFDHAFLIHFDMGM